jgi:hypothetical protein
MKRALTPAFKSNRLSTRWLNFARRAEARRRQRGKPPEVARRKPRSGAAVQGSGQLHRPESRIMKPLRSGFQQAYKRPAGRRPPAPDVGPRVSQAANDKCELLPDVAAARCHVLPGYAAGRQRLCERSRRDVAVELATPGLTILSPL